MVARGTVVRWHGVLPDYMLPGVLPGYIHHLVHTRLLPSSGYTPLLPLIPAEHVPVMDVEQ